MNDPGSIFWVFPGPTSSLDFITWLGATRELRRQGWKVILAVGRETSAPIAYENEVTCFPYPNIYLLRQVVFHYYILRFILKDLFSYDFILFHQLSLPWILPLRLVRWLLRKSNPFLVMDTRTVPMEDRDRTFKDWLRGAFYNLMNRAANHCVDGQTATTLRMAQQVAIPRRRLWGVWHAGVDVHRFSVAVSLRRWPVGDEPIRLIYIGALQYERNLLGLSEAVVRANQNGRRFLLLITGSGAQQNELEVLANNNPGFLRVSPSIPHDEVPALLATAHVGTLTLLDAPQFLGSSPLKLFEYMGSGLPVLVTKIPCNTDVIQEEGYAFWADSPAVEDLEKALEQVWSRRNELERMGRLALAAADCWSWEDSARRLSAALRSGAAAFGKRSARKDRGAQEESRDGTH